MSRFRVAPQKGHLECLKRVYGYLLRFREVTIRILTEEPDFSEIPEQKFDCIRDTDNGKVFYTGIICR